MLNSLGNTCSDGGGIGFDLPLGTPLDNNTPDSEEGQSATHVLVQGAEIEVSGTPRVETSGLGHYHLGT